MPSKQRAFAVRARLRAEGQVPRWAFNSMANLVLLWKIWFCNSTFYAYEIRRYLGTRAMFEGINNFIIENGVICHF